MKKKEKNIYIFFIKMLLIFISLDVVMMLFSDLLATSSLFAKYGVDLIYEVFYAIAILVVMLLFKNSYVFTEKKEKFWKSICLGMPILVITIFNFIVNITELKSVSILSFINAFVLCVFIGIAEEFLCRGWLQNEFMERFSGDKKSVLKSIILASLVFGVMHIVNVASQTLFETILQIINATAVGMLLGSVYYKTKNIWSVIFLHGFYDFAIFLGEINLIKDCTYGNPTLGITIVECISIITISLYWIFGALKVLNTPSSKNEKINKKKDYFYTTMIVITFILIFIPFSSLVPEYENYKTCYEYMEIDSFNNYEVHYPVHDKYYINEKELITRLEEETDGKEIVEVTNKIEYLISFKLNDNKTVNIKNENTTYEVQLPYKNVEQMELVENEDYFFSVIYTTENDGTVYYTEIKKSDLRNSRDLIDFIAGSYKSYAVPELSRVGYINIESNVEKYPYLVSSNNDVFIIKNDNIFLINKGI